MSYIYTNTTVELLKLIRLSYVRNYTTYYYYYYYYYYYTVSYYFAKQN